MGSELLIYQQNVIDTYLYFLKDNLGLIRNIDEEKRKLSKSYDPNKKWELYPPRAKHLQIMSLIGLTAEHLIKIILLKRGFVLNTGDFEANFTQDFMQVLIKANKQELTTQREDELYEKAKITFLSSEINLKL